MFFPSVFLLGLVQIASSAAILGSSCSTPLGLGSSKPGDPFWMAKIRHQGTSPFNPAPASYQVFRNVKDFGAKGDGVTDDTEAINAAISAGNRCGGGGCQSSTITPAVVYIPPGTYVVSAPVIAMYLTQIMGDPKQLPTLLASPTFRGMAVIDADPYIPGGGGAQWYINQNNFRAVRNLIIDVRQMPGGAFATGLHWQVSQATSLYNIVFHMSTAPGNNHQGIWMENGSGGFMGDLTFNGGRFGMWVGNQQFTLRNITVNNAETAIYALWNWGWTFQGIQINDCKVGFDLATSDGVSGQTVGAEAIIDATIKNTGVFVRTSRPSIDKLAGSLVINNAKLIDTPIAVGVLNGPTVLAGGTTTIESWAQGNTFVGTKSTGFKQGPISAPKKGASLLDSQGHIFQKTRPQYENYVVDEFISVKSAGAKGDGVTDDTDAIKAIFDKYAGCKIIFFDAGVYVVTSTITIPAGTKMVGEAWTLIAGKGAAFQDASKPQAIIRAGETGSVGLIEISDIVFVTIGPTAGAIVLEWNIHDAPGQPGSGMWDAHIRLGGAQGTQLQPATCPIGNTSPSCAVAFLALHLTKQSSAYLETTWVWTADHDLDGDGLTQISLFSTRGVLSESQGPVWFIGTGSEHHIMYEYSLVKAANHYMGLIQTESPYFQPVPAAPGPFAITNKAYSDPVFTSDVTSAWALHIENSSNILVFGAGLYSFFQNYGQTCITTRSCQSQIVNVDAASTGIYLYSVSTVASTSQISVAGVSVVNQINNINGFASTVTVWSSE